MSDWIDSLGRFVMSPDFDDLLNQSSLQASFSAETKFHKSSYQSCSRISAASEIGKDSCSAFSNVRSINDNFSRSPRFIAWGVVFCALSCFILALPHFIYGAGEDALRLTKEYMDSSNSTIVRLNVIPHH